MFSLISNKNKNYVLRILIALIALVSILLIKHLMEKKSYQTFLIQDDSHRLQNNLNRKIEHINGYLGSQDFIKNVLNVQKRTSLIQDIDRQGIGMAVFEYGDLTFWSKSPHVPIYALYTQEENENIYTYKGNVYYFKKKKIENSPYTMVGFVELYLTYPVRNKLLENGFNPDFQLGDEYKLMTKDIQDNLETAILTPDQKPLFYITQNTDYTDRSLLNFVLLLFALAALFVLIHYSYLLFQQNGYALFALFFLFVCWIVLFFTANHFKSWFGLSAQPLFSSEIYASSIYLNSLGTLLVVLLFGLYFFHRLYRNIRFLDFCKKNRFTFIFLAISLGLVWTLINYIIRGLVLHSSLSLDFYNQIQISPLILYCIFIIFLVNALHFYFLIFISKLFGRNLLLKEVITLTLISIGTYILMSIYMRFQWFDVLAGSIIAAFLNYFSFIIQRKHLSVYSFNRILVVALFYSVFTNCILLSYNTVNMDNEMLVFGKKQLEDKDVILEYTLNSEISNIAEDNFIKTFFNNPYAISGNIVLDKIQKNYISSYLNPFESNIYLMDASGYALEATHPYDYPVIQAEFEKNNLDINVDGVYTIKENLKGNKYYSVVNFKNENGTLQGRLMIEIQAKSSFSNSVYPELLIQNDNVEDNITNIFNYAIYHHNYLSHLHGEYIYDNYESSLAKDQAIYYDRDDFHHLKYSSENEDIIIVSIKAYTFYRIFSTFVLWFTLFILLIIIFYLLDMTLKSIYNRSSIYQQLLHSFSNKLQVTIVLLIVFAIVLLASFSTRFFIDQNSKKQYAKINEKQNIISKVLQEEFVNEYADSLNNPDFINYKILELQSKIKYLAERNMIDINIYNIYGEYIASSQNDIFTKGVVPPMMQPMAYNQLMYGNKNVYIAHEKIGNLNYISIYKYLTNGLNQPIAILNIPYFDEQKENSQAVSQYLISMLSAYTVILIFAIALSLLLSRQLTVSIRAIGNRLNKIKLQDTNERLQWDGDDEIGELVHEYNRMVEKLEENVKQLADSEREKAWREMAKQVAHEIKNPLTPMKLNLQYLQKAIHEDNANVKELSKRFTANLIEQIDLLTAIATQFSQFAQMPAAHPEKIFLNNLLLSLTELHSKDSQIHCFYNNEVDDNVEVFIDKNYLIRVITNIIKNGTQAIPEERMGVINITLSKNETHAIITIQDNGTGIPEDFQDQVFLPHFSTKSSGMGIGLSMCKNIIENAQGRIYFETEQEIGTKFFIELPLYYN